MLFDVVLFSGLSLAFTIAQAGIPFGPASQFTRRQTVLISGTVYISEVDVIFSSVGAGVRIPTVRGKEGDSVTFGIGLDSAGCQYGSLKLGINATVDQHHTTYSAVYYDNTCGWQLMPLDVSAEDSVLLVIDANEDNMTFANGVMENLTKGDVAEVHFTRSNDTEKQQPCGHDPAWFVDTTSPNSSVTVEFLHPDANTTNKEVIYPNNTRASVAYGLSGNVNVNVTKGSGNPLAIQLIGNT